MFLYPRENLNGNRNTHAPFGCHGTSCCPLEIATHAQQGVRKSKAPYTYLAFDVRPEELPQAVNGMRALGARGWNVTIPHKVAIMALLDEVNDEARRIGAVNTVVNDGGKLIGMNTDGAGYLRSLEEKQVFVWKNSACSFRGGKAPQGRCLRFGAVRRSECRHRQSDCGKSRTAPFTPATPDGRQSGSFGRD